MESLIEVRMGPSHCVPRATESRRDYSDFRHPCGHSIRTCTSDRAATARARSGREDRVADSTLAIALAVMTLWACAHDQNVAHAGDVGRARTCDRDDPSRREFGSLM